MELTVFPWKRHAKLLGGDVVSLLLAAGRNGCCGCAVRAADADGELLAFRGDGASHFMCRVSELPDFKKLCGENRRA